MAKTKKVIVDAPSDALNPIPNEILGAIHQGDCIEKMRDLPEGSVQLVFADPPFNIGYEYDVYDDSLERDKYLEWSKNWIGAVHRVLIPTGTFWLAIGDEYAAELKVISQQVGFHCRSWVVWYYTFGVHCRAKFTRSHAHLFHFVKDPTRFTFNASEIAVPSARQLVYADARANPAGRTPDDTWILRPQDCTEGLTPHEDTWYFPRVNGTFKERAGFHGCQMPEQLLGRIIRACSRPDNIVLDPFSGSATTVAVAKKLGRRFVGFDLSPEYVELGSERLKRIFSGQPLDGAPDPKISAPATKDGKQRGQSVAARPSRRTQSQSPLLPFPEEMVSEEDRIREAYGESYRGSSVVRVIIDPILNEDFQRACDAKEIPGTPAERNRILLKLKKQGQLQEFDRSLEQVVAPKWQQVDLYAFASEIAWRRMKDLYRVELEELFCDPRIAATFDQIASHHAPGYLPLEYRWGALMLRDVFRSSQQAIRLSATDDLGAAEWRRATIVLGTELNVEELPVCECLYAIENIDSDEVLFVGETLNLQRRMGIQWGDGRIATTLGLPPSQARIKFLQLPSPKALPMVCRSWLLGQHATAWNLIDEDSVSEAEVRQRNESDSPAAQGTPGSESLDVDVSSKQT